MREFMRKHGWEFYKFSKTWYGTLLLTTGSFFLSAALYAAYAATVITMLRLVGFKI